MSRSSISTTSSAKSCARSSRSCSRRANDGRVRDDRADWKRCSSAATRRCSTQAGCCSRDRRWRFSARPATLAAARAFSDPPLNPCRPGAVPSAIDVQSDCRSRTTPRQRSPAGYSRARALAAGDAGRRCAAAAASSSRRSAAPNFHPPRARRRAPVAQVPGRARPPAQRACTLYISPREPVWLRSQRPPAVRAGELSVARIDLEDVGHRYAESPRTRWALRPMTMTLERRRRLRAARPVRLRQDDAAEHHLRLDHADARQGVVRRPRRDRACRRRRATSHRCSSSLSSTTR